MSLQYRRTTEHIANSFHNPPFLFFVPFILHHKIQQVTYDFIMTTPNLLVGDLVNITGFTYRGQTGAIQGVTPKMCYVILSHNKHIVRIRIASVILSNDVKPPTQALPVELQMIDQLLQKKLHNTGAEGKKKTIVQELQNIKRSIDKLIILLRETKY